MISRAQVSLAVFWLMALTGARAASAATSYFADPGASRLEFAGVQAGAEFKGVFHHFTAAIDFAPEALASSHFDVQIDLTSVDTLDKDRDNTIRSPDIFDAAHFPTARYVASGFTKTATGYRAAGMLTLHGITKSVPLEFQFLAPAGSAKLQGTTNLRRLEFGVGQGDWKSTEWVGDEVKVVFSLVLKPKT